MRVYARFRGRRNRSGEAHARGARNCAEIGDNGWEMPLPPVLAQRLRRFAALIPTALDFDRSQPTDPSLRAEGEAIHQQALCFLVDCFVGFAFSQ